MRYLTRGHALVPECLVFPHMDHNTLIYKQIRLSRSFLLPAPLQFPVPALITSLFCLTAKTGSILLSFSSSFKYLPLLLSCLSLFLSHHHHSLLLPRGASGKTALFLTLMSRSGAHGAVCRVKGFVLSSIRNRRRVPLDEHEPQCPSAEDVSVAASSRYCHSDVKSITSSERGRANVSAVQGQFKVTGP